MPETPLATFEAARRFLGVAVLRINPDRLAQERGRFVEALLSTKHERQIPERFFNAAFITTKRRVRPSVSWGRFPTPNLLDRLGDSGADLWIVVVGRGFEVGEKCPARVR